MIKIITIYLVVLQMALVCTNVHGQEEERPLPDWWHIEDFQMPRKDSVIEQYFYIRENFLKSAYVKKDEHLFKKSIIAYIKLIDWFRAETDMATSSMAQFQIAEAYKQIGDIERANEAYKKCLLYERYLKKEVRDRADGTILAVIRASQGRLNGQALSKTN